MSIAAMILIGVISLGSLWALVNPAVGILLWTGISIMNPHTQVWGTADMPVAMMVGVATLVGLLFCRDKRIFLTTPTFFLLFFMFWVCLTYFNAIHRAESYEMFDRVMKIDLMILVAVMLLHSKQHVMALIWVLVISLGYYGVKGGLFTIATGGGYRVWGPSGFIGGNNELGLALVLIVPFMYFLMKQLQTRWLRYVMAGVCLLTVVAALGTQSRGALLGVVAMALVLWWRGSNRLLLGVGMIIVSVLLLTFLPDTWYERMSTIVEYKEDGSAMGRINAWWMCWNLAKDHPWFGGGFGIYTPDLFAQYAPVPEDIHVAHSIYFSVLGEHGFAGFFIWLMIWLMTWRWAGWLRVNAANHAETFWASQLGGMCQVALAGYAVAGAFLSLAYFDLPYNILVLVVVARRWVEAKQAELKNLPGTPQASKPVRSLSPYIKPTV